MRLYILLSFLMGFINISCSKETVLLPSENTGGPKVVFDLTWSTPIAQSPLPNDVLTQSTQSILYQGQQTDTFHPLASTWMNLTQYLQNAPTHPWIYLPLEQSIDLDLLLKLQSNQSIDDDAIYLLCISEQCDGEVIPLDFGQASKNDQLLTTINKRKMGLDTSLNAHLSRMSLPLPPHLTQDIRTVDRSSLIWNDQQQQQGHMYQWALQDTDEMMAPTSRSDLKAKAALVFRPLQPLQAHSRYMVIISKQLVDQNGHSIVSPFTSVYHPQQRAYVDQVLENLSNLNLRAEGIAFMWSFTTGDPTTLMQYLHKSMRGLTPLSTALSNLQGIVSPEKWKPKAKLESNCDAVEDECKPNDTTWYLDRPSIQAIAHAWIQAEGATEEQLYALDQSYDYVDGLYAGTLQSWFLSDEQQHWLDLPKRTYKSKWNQLPDLTHLKRSLVSVNRPFWCIIPKSAQWQDEQLTTQKREAPFPTVIWSSDGMSERLELLKWAGYWASMGLASCAIESRWGDGRVEETINNKTKVDQIIQDFTLSLYTKAVDADWDPALVLSSLNLGDTHAGEISTITKHHSIDAFPSLLNRSLSLQQFAYWLRQMKEDETGRDVTMLRQILASKLELDKSDDISSYAISYGGNGVGASAAMLASSVDRQSTRVVVDNVQADWSRYRATGLGDHGATYTLNSILGPWLSLELLTGNEYQLFWLNSDSTEDSIIRIEATEQSWIALQNVQYNFWGKAHQIQEMHPLTVGCKKGDQLRLWVWSTGQEITQGNSYDLTCLTTGWGAEPQSPQAQMAWYWDHWRTQLFDPMSYAPYLWYRPMIDDEKNSIYQDHELLIVNHLLDLQGSTAASVSLANASYLMNQSIREDLRQLDEESFLLQTSAYEPYTRWLQEVWIDWDDVRDQTSTSLSDYYSFQMKVQQTNFRGYQSLVRHIISPIFLASSNSYNNSKEVPIYSMNLIANFLTYPWYDFNQWNDMCLHSFAWDLTSCRTSTQLP